MKPLLYDVIVIGAGPAGCLAAATAAKQGKNVLLLEKNNRIGKKLAITGKGRCNLTNLSDVNEHIINCPKNGKFITNALYRFPPQAVISLFENLGVPTKVERGNRVFPVSDKASHVVAALQKYLEDNAVKLLFDNVQGLAKINDIFAVLGISGNRYEANSLVIATGGKSYPATGSTGDGYNFAKKMGHTINLLKPSLVPVEVEEKWVSDLMGLSLKNVSIRILNSNNKVLYSDFGEMLFTHFGLSGPIILSASSHVQDIAGLKLVIDLKPALDDQILDKRLLREFNENPNKQLNNLLKNLLPQKMIEPVIKLSRIEPDRAVNSIRKDERKNLLHILKNLTFTLTRFRPLKEAIITSGGVLVNEIDPRTMESRIVDDLYFAGEIIDVDSHTGGFNLQIAFATGFLAGSNA